MNVDFFFPRKVPLSNANPGQPWRMRSPAGVGWDRLQGWVPVSSPCGHSKEGGQRLLVN